MRKILFGALVAITVLACRSSQTKSQPTASSPQTAQQQGGQCPMKEMAGAKVTATDTADGVALEFTTTGDVEALRAHVHKMADMHNGMAESHDGDMHGGMGSGDMHGMHGGEMHGGMKMVPSKATAEDIPGGARVVLVPNASVDGLRAFVITRVVASPEPRLR